MNWYFSSGIPCRSEGVFIELQTLVCVPTQKAAAVSLDKVVVVATLTCYFQTFFKEVFPLLCAEIVFEIGSKKPYATLLNKQDKYYLHHTKSNSSSRPTIRSRFY